MGYMVVLRDAEGSHRVKVDGESGGIAYKQ
jgi:hypothetical protein